MSLDKAETGLANKVANYIADGSGSSVLSTLGTTSVSAAWKQRQYTYPRKTPADKMLGVEGAEPALLRLGEVLAVLDPAPAANQWSYYGTAVSPDWLRHAVSGIDPQSGLTCRMERLVQLAELGKAPPSAILDILMHPGPGVSYGTHNALARFPGAEAWLAAHPAEVREHQAPLDAGARAELAAVIGGCRLADTHLDLLLHYGVSSAKTVRAAAAKALTGAEPEGLVAAMDRLYADSNTATRTELVNLAFGALGRDAEPLLIKWLAGESDKRPREALERALSNVALTTTASGDPGQAATDVPEGGYVALDGSTVEFPPAGVPPAKSAISNEAIAALRKSADSYNAAVAALRAETREQKYHWTRHSQAIDGAALAAFKRGAEGGPFDQQKRGGRRPSVTPLFWNSGSLEWDRSGVAAFFADPSITVRHLITILHWEGHRSLLPLTTDGFAHQAAQELRKRPERDDLRMLAEIWADLGGEEPVLQHLQSRWYSPLEGIEPAVLAPQIARSLDLLDEAFGMRPQAHQPSLSMQPALNLLGILPKVPQRYLLPLMAIATGGTKAMRLQARDLLAGAPDIDDAIIDQLSESKQETRAGAAEWLAARNAKQAIPALRKALAKEKSDLARAAIITAREKLGDDVSDCFDPANLLAEAKTGLGKTPAKGLEWFPFDLLPRLSWADGAQVEPEIVRWWVVLANKLKQPGGNALLDLWLDRLKPADAQKLSLFVLRSWIDQDTRTPSDDEANTYAAGLIDSMLQSNIAAAKRWPASAAYYITDRELLFAQIKRNKRGEYLGSAAENKGILALASHAEGADAAAAARSFLKDHGSRVSQAKSIIETLANNAAPAAIQVVLATANRFKARTVQEHAAALIEAIAERRGWTSEELADRTIPTAGLDERGEADLDLGPDRSYRLVLDAEDALVLLNSEGKPVKSLPTARNDEEKPLIAAAKKQLATAKKELKQAISAQTDRLYEAMCLERRWPVAEWERHLLRHPITGRILRRIVWMGLDAEGKVVTLFRPLDDGSLTDAGDSPVALDRLAKVQIAHANLVSTEEAEAWRTHLEDYEVASAFEQFGTDLPELPTGAAEKTAIDDRLGWLIESFKLRGAATKAGYVRGQAEDGGVFYTYERRYDGAGIIALIEFTGSPLPEENIPSALKTLRFARLRKGTGWHGRDIALKDVPRVLLAESWKDLHRIAAAGTGFDPKWEKKAGW